jgi:predicted dehydrogenase
MFQIIKKIIPYQIPLFIEKPAALSLMQLRELITLNKKYKTPNMIGLNRRYYSIIQKGISLIGNNNISSVAIEGHESYWRIKNSKKHKDIKNNWLFANSIHTIDLLSYISNSKIKKISILNLKKNNSENNISAIMKFKNGVLGSYNSFWSSPGQWSLKIFGNDKTVIFGPLEDGYLLDRNFVKKIIKPIKEDTIYKPGFYLQSLNFIKLMRTKKNSWPDVTISSLIDSYTLIENFNLKND